jgi:hypothetical protein
VKRTLRCRRADECPDADTHTPHPTGYLEHADWAVRMMRTHVQRRCPTCGFWTIWLPKRRTVPS